MAPVIQAFRKAEITSEIAVCVTAQHREMLDQVLAFFSISPRYDLNVMQQGQSLFGLTTAIIQGMEHVLSDFRPDIVLVHGDTTTSMAVALASYYAKVPVAHVEAGLRTYQRYSPFPEEINRQLTGRLATYHFAPTDRARKHLLEEGVPSSAIYVTGNTVVDACLRAQQVLKRYMDDEIGEVDRVLANDRQCILVTAHRRENHDSGLRNICHALRRLAGRPDVQLIFPVHRNPAVRQVISAELSGVANIALIDPLGYPAFMWLMLRSHSIISDSGGIQEEATVLGKPVLVMRDVSERPEAVISGSVKLVGTDAERIYAAAITLLDDKEAYGRMAGTSSVYGDGKSAERIADIVLNL